MKKSFSYDSISQYMQTTFTAYPAVPWKQGWALSAGPEAAADTLTTGVSAGELRPSRGEWRLRLAPEGTSLDMRPFAEALSVSTPKRPEKNHTDLLFTEPGVLRGQFTGLPAPSLSAPRGLQESDEITLLETAEGVTLLLKQKDQFALIIGAGDRNEAMQKAEAALEKSFDSLGHKAAAARKQIVQLFGINPRHNPPVALAAEQLRRRLREHTRHIHGLWSAAEGFEQETFSLNELYPLVKAWLLIDPTVARRLVSTALSLQQGTGGFPAWAAGDGPRSAAAPWPLLVQAFELVWETDRDPLFLNKHLPALRKYLQWALRHFDPQRNRMPAWQNTQELFTPEAFEHGKATPELTAMLLEEIDALKRLCKESDLAESAANALDEERENLSHALNTVFWDPAAKAFSNIWKNGHILHAPSFGSFLPLLFRQLDSTKKGALLEQLETTHGFPGDGDSGDWKQEDIADTEHRPAVHQFMAFSALQTADASRALLMLFVRRSREAFAGWFERECLEAARLQSQHEESDATAFALGPVVAALILTVQKEFLSESAKHSRHSKTAQRLFHALRLNAADLRIIGGCLIGIVLIHLLYRLPTLRSAEAQVNEAVLNYRQGNYEEVLRTCLRYPELARTQFLHANLLVRAGHPEEAEELYQAALIKNPQSPSALFGLALTLQMNGRFDEAVKRYTNFIDIHSAVYPDAAQIAETFRTLAEEQFSEPPRWQALYASSLMNDL